MFKYFLDCNKFFINKENKLNSQPVRVEFSVKFWELLALIFSPFSAHFTILTALFSIPLYFVFSWLPVLLLSSVGTLSMFLFGSWLDDKDIPTSILYNENNEIYVELVDENAAVIDKFSKMVNKAIQETIWEEEEHD